MFYFLLKIFFRLNEEIFKLNHQTRKIAKDRSARDKDQETKLSKGQKTRRQVCDARPQ